MSGQEVRPIKWEDGKLVLLDQRLLPHQEQDFICSSPQDAAEAIRTMVVRGAPAIGCTAAYGMALAARNLPDDSAQSMTRLDEARKMLAETRPTAINLFWALDRVYQTARKAAAGGGEKVRRAVEEEAQAIFEEDLASCRAMGEHGCELVPAEARIMTHCNAGALATAGYGTALGVIRSAHAAGKLSQVISCETRPRQQGARLTVWELMREHIPVSLISDTAAGYMMRTGQVNFVVVGADRIAANGDTANKIGTYNLAVLAKENGIPFTVAAPVSTIDPDTPNGQAIPVEERESTEVTVISGQLITVDGARALNPAFDVTPARYIAAIITEHGVCRPPFEESVGALLKKHHFKFKTT